MAILPWRRKKNAMADEAPRQAQREILAEVAHLIESPLFAPSEGVRVYNPSQLVSRKGLKIFDDMMRDDVVANAVEFVKHAALSTGWTIKSDDAAGADMLLEQLDSIEGTFTDALLDVLSALEYGFSVTEKLFELRDGAIALRGFRTVPPNTVQFDLDVHGNIMRIVQLESSYSIAAGQEIPKDKVILFQNQPRFGNPYGRSILESAYRPWLIKDNSYKWLAMALERHGVPSVFALYDPAVYRGAALDDLREVLQNIQAATAGTIPRPPNGLEIWEPKVATESGQLFSEAIGLFDRAIARALLMPAMIGFADSEGGSLARARVHFDSFLIVVEHLRSRLADALNEQLIRQLVALLLPGAKDPAAYWFEFLPFSDDKRADLFRLWAELVRDGVVRPTVADERYLRETLGMPELPEGVASPAPAPEPEKQEQAARPQGVHRYASERVDFAAIDKRLNSIEEEAVERIREAIGKVRDTLLTWIGDDVTAADVNNLQLRGLGAFQDAVMEFLRVTYQAGAADLRGELGRPEGMSSTEGTFVPASAMAWLAAKKFYITGVFKDAVLKEVRAILLNALKTGELVADTKAKVRGVFEQWIGSGTVLTTEARLETIIRTNATDAYNYGRLSEIRAHPDAVEAVEFSAILDTRTTEQCKLLHGRFFRADDPVLAKLTPPLHYNCRSLIVPVPAGAKIDKDMFVNPRLIGEVMELVPPGFGGGR